MKEEAEMAIPELFKCPISLELFKDPVTLSTGQTYDRSSIQKWLSLGNLTCPVTMQKLHDSSMVPNHTLHHLINQWLSNNPSRLLSQQLSNQAVASALNQCNDPSILLSQQLSGQTAASALDNCNNPSRLLSQQLSDQAAASALKRSLRQPDYETRIKSLGAIRAMSQDLPFGNSWLIEFGFLSILLELVFDRHEKGVTDLNFVEEALVCAIKLLPHCSNLRPLEMLKEEAKLDYFLVLVTNGTATIKKCLCQLVEAVSLSSQTRELCGFLGTNSKLIHGLMLLLDTESGINAISALCSWAPNRDKLVQEGVIGGLISVIMSTQKNKKVSPMALSALKTLMALESAKKAVVDHPKGVNALVKMVFRVSDHEGSESAIDLLIVLCSESGAVRERAICDGVLTQLLLLLQSQCSGRIKNKARMFLKLLRSMWGV